VIKMVTQPLDLQTIFVNYFAGTLEIFFFIAMIGFSILAAKFRMPNQIFLIMLGVFIVVMTNFYPLFYTIVILLVGLLFYYTISKLIKT